VKDFAISFAMVKRSDDVPPVAGLDGSGTT
jgi:hypothetical protein